jgi:hypothetical protein
MRYQDFERRAGEFECEKKRDETYPEGAGRRVDEQAGNPHYLKPVIAKALVPHMYLLVNGWRV